MSETKITTKRMRLDEIQPMENNPRRKLRPEDREYQKIRKSIEEHGLVEPLVWNQRSGQLVGGHQRAQVLQDLGYEEVDVSVVDLDEQRERSLNLALNAITGAWDRHALIEQLQLLRLSDIDAEAFGFTEPELDGMLEVSVGEEGLGDSLEDEGRELNKCPRCGHEW